MQDTEWKREWFTNDQPHGYWNSKQNQRTFFESLATKLNIQRPHQWGRVTKRDLLQAGGGRLLNRYGSIRKALQSIFPSKYFLWTKLKWKRNSMAERMVHTCTILSKILLEGQIQPAKFFGQSCINAWN